MYFDVFTISALVDEFLDTIVGGRIQDSLDVDETGLGLEIYANRRRHYLYLSADQSIPRMYIAGEKLRRGLPRPTQVGLLFRRYVEGGRVTHVSQPSWERILHIDVEGSEGDVEIVIEPMERRSNILLLKDGVILDCMRRVGPKDNRHRLSLPAHEYVPPPPQVGKRDPFLITSEDMIGFFTQTTDLKRKTFQVLTGHLLGMSPQLAREVVFRSGGEPRQKAQDASPVAIFDALQEVIIPLKQRDWQPGIAEDDGSVSAFSVYSLKHIPGWKKIESVSAAIVAYYGAPVGEDAYNAAKIPAQKAIGEARKKLNAKLASLERSLTDDVERELLRQSGELILAYQYTLKEEQDELRAQYDVAGEELVITLDPSLSPLDNAQRYFSRYNKAKRALDDVPRLVNETKNELAYVAQLETDLNLATNWPGIGDVQQALQNRGYWQGTKTKASGGGQSTAIRIVTKDGYVIWVGRNSRQNELVTFKKAKSDDFWLHARDIPGSHVVIRFDGRRIPKSVIEQAAALAAYYSAHRHEKRVPVDMTRCKYVKKIKGAGQGMVTYRNEETFLTIPRDEKYFEE
jgi:predicted ribosome quality control (RQC) complex YloA/Tae2 family protein